MILGTWWIESHFDQFDPAQVNEGTNTGVETQVVPDGSGRLRYRMTCPRCGATPTFTAERIDRALKALYEKDAYDRVIPYRV